MNDKTTTAPGLIPGQLFAWAEMDLNHRRHKPTGLQPVPFGRSGTDPCSTQIVSPLRLVSTFEMVLNSEGEDEEDEQDQR